MEQLKSTRSLSIYLGLGYWRSDVLFGRAMLGLLLTCGYAILRP